MCAGLRRRHDRSVIRAALSHAAPSPEQVHTWADGYAAALHAGYEATRLTNRICFVDLGHRAREFLRLIEARPDGTGKSVHAFVALSDGTVHKPHSWSRPTRNRAGELQPRFSLADEAEREALFAYLATGAGNFGRHLYADFRLPLMAAGPHAGTPTITTTGAGEEEK